MKPSSSGRWSNGSDAARGPRSGKLADLQLRRYAGGGGLPPPRPWGGREEVANRTSVSCSAGTFHPREPLRGLLHAARARGLAAELLDLRSSGDTAGDRDSVVGYGAFALRPARGGTDSA